MLFRKTSVQPEGFSFALVQAVTPGGSASAVETEVVAVLELSAVCSSGAGHPSTIGDPAK